MFGSNVINANRIGRKLRNAKAFGYIDLARTTKQVKDREAILLSHDQDLLEARQRQAVPLYTTQRTAICK